MPLESLPTYHTWSADWKKRIQSAQIKAALQVNAEALSLYWELGKDIVLQQKNSSWGDGLIPRFAKDLKEAFPHLSGFSRTNLFYIRKWFLFYQGQIEIVPQLVGQFQSNALTDDNHKCFYYSSPCLGGITATSLTNVQM